MSQLFVFDLDATCTNVGKRFKSKRPAGKRGDKAYEAWLKKCEAKILSDKPVTGIRSILKALEASEANVVYLTSRRDHNRSKTLQWLKKHNFPLFPLVMRAEEDNRRSHELKRYAVNHLLKHYNCTHATIVDDDPSGLLAKEAAKEGWTFLKALNNGYMPS